MFEDLRSAFKEALDNFNKELSRDQVSETADKLLVGMKNEIADEKAQVAGLDDQLRKTLEQIDRLIEGDQIAAALEQTKRLCDKVEGALVDLEVNAAAIHGDLSQAARERALQRFADGRLAVLVATDVAARGIDIDDIGAVVHYDPPGDVKDYLHRSGRTARAGRDGWAVTLVEYNQHTQVRVLQRLLRLPSVKPIEVFSNDERLLDLSRFEGDAPTT